MPGTRWETILVRAAVPKAVFKIVLGCGDGAASPGLMGRGEEWHLGTRMA